MLTVACVWVNANVQYGAEYVIKLNAMVTRHLNRPFKFVCFTDRPVLVSPVVDRAIPIQIPKGMFGWWAKVHLFNPEHNLAGRVLYLDLDTLVVDDLAPIVDYPADFALVPHAGTFQGRNGLQVVKRFNSSVMVWDAGTQDRIYTNWTPKTTERLWGDQDHIGEQCPDAATMPASWFPRLSELRWPMPVTEAKVVLCKVPKNTVAAKILPGFAEAWAGGVITKPTMNVASDSRPEKAKAL